MEAFLWEVVLLPRSELGGCERGLFVLFLVGEEQKVGVCVGMNKRWLERQAGFCRDQRAKVGSLT